MREIDRLAEDLAVVERDLASHALASEDVRRLMTLPGANMVVALGLLAAIGDVSRFASPDRLVSYLGLNPSVRQSGPGPTYHGRITKQGRGAGSWRRVVAKRELGWARGLLVEAAWVAGRSPGPLRAFYERVRARRDQHIAAVTVARKLAVVAWHLLSKQQDYAWCRPALQARKRRDLELKAGFASQRGGNKKGSAYAYNIKAVREQEKRWVEQAEQAYTRFVTGWHPRGPAARRDATNGKRPL